MFRLLSTKDQRARWPICTTLRLGSVRKMNGRRTAADGQNRVRACAALEKAGAQEPHMPSRQQRRKVRVELTFDLIQIRASRTIGRQSSRSTK
jgi:hypothetical protein